MPELPEVHTTVIGLDSILPGLVIDNVWTDYDSPYFYGKEQIKDPAYFKKFKKTIVGVKIKSVSRRAKNILIHLENENVILIHMKMTGHLMYGEYRKTDKRDTGPWEDETWVPAKEGLLKDPFNRFIHVVFTLSNEKHLILSDMRKFAKVILIKKPLESHKDIKILGKEPFTDIKNWKEYKAELLKKPNGKVKQVLMDQSLIVGIGNIYSDEILWASFVSPFRLIKDISDSEWKKIYLHTLKILMDSISKGGDSLSDYRNAFGEKGDFQNFHKAYRQTGKSCSKKGCAGIIQRAVIGGRSSHYCNKHQA
jgi:formamidopyrimidine-DNA glycosylase